MRLDRVVKRNVGTSSVWWEYADAKYERTTSPSSLEDAGSHAYHIMQVVHRNLRHEEGATGRRTGMSAGSSS